MNNQKQIIPAPKQTQFPTTDHGQLATDNPSAKTNPLLLDFFLLPSSFYLFTFLPSTAQQWAQQKNGPDFPSFRIGQQSATQSNTFPSIAQKPCRASHPPPTAPRQNEPSFPMNQNKGPVTRDKGLFPLP